VLNAFREPRAGFRKSITALGKNTLPPTARFYLRTIQSCFCVQLAYLRRDRLAKAFRGFEVYLRIVANLISALRLLPKRRQCEFCGWSGFAFLPIYYVDGYRAEVFCPRCRLMDRYRTLVHFARKSRWGLQMRESKPHILEVAPAASTRKTLKQEFNAREVVGFDIANRWAEIIGDVQQMQLPDESFDLFICYEVLDYIPNDRVALSELYRVLKPGGYGLLRVGFDLNLAVTTEYSAPDADDSYHIRRYGRDLPDRLRSAKFEVELFDLTAGVTRADCVRFGLETAPVFFLRRPAC
jgi:SAM-dependent methyltransferase